MITPKEAQPLRDMRVGAMIEALEQRIDEMLTRPPNAFHEWWFNEGNIPAGVNITALMDRYRAAGWKVRREHDQRDGSALVFSEAK